MGVIGILSKLFGRVDDDKSHQCPYKIEGKQESVHSIVGQFGNSRIRCSYCGKEHDIELVSCPYCRRGFL